ncbi:MAG: NAD(P)H-hydrate dehydratase [Verrucomicrobiales bacterium]|nr:NAD(P)H-hydrate dehydratase [Verrucomicrobiales bacterium]
MLVTCRQMQQIEAAAFERGEDAADLMDQVGRRMAEILIRSFPTPGTAILYLGRGNNAGDALVAGRELAARGWRLLARATAAMDAWKPLPRQHFTSLGGHITLLEQAPGERDLPPGPLLLLDGLVGIGASGPLRGAAAELAREMNGLRQSHHAQVIALDLPSGLDADTGAPGDPAVRADITLTVAHAKTGLVADTATDHVGRLVVLPIPALAAPPDDPAVDDARVLTAAKLRDLLPARPFDLHKGQAGRVHILAGGPGCIGAAEMCCRGALRAGAGLVTLHAAPSAYQLLAARMPAEVMVRRTPDLRALLEAPMDGLAIGPGLTGAEDSALLEIIESAPSAAVLDAEALNLLSRQPDLTERLQRCQGPRILTPHPGEFERLRRALGRHRPSADRRSEVEAFVAAHPGCTLLLKGARTLIAGPGSSLAFNGTGHPGMATGGMGDVLTGVIAALLGQGLPGCAAAQIGAWVCGHAAQIACRSSAQRSLLPTDLIEALPAAWLDLEHGLD